MSSVSDNTSSNFSKDENYYDILGIKPSANQIDIRNAYNKSVERWHPDRNRQPIANRKFLDVNNAYQVLSNDNSRRLYNTALKSGVNFTYNFKDPYDVYHEFQSIKKEVETKLKGNLEKILCKLENKNIRYKTRRIIDRQLIVVNDRPFEKLMEMTDSGIIYVTYVHENGMRQSIMDDKQLDIVLSSTKS